MSWASASPPCLITLSGGSWLPPAALWAVHVVGGGALQPTALEDLEVHFSRYLDIFMKQF